MLPVPDTPLLTPAEIRALPDGAKVLVRWCGGNGPHLYTLRHRSYDGEPPFDVCGYATLSDGSETLVGVILSWDHELQWQPRPLTHMLEEVWLPDPAGGPAL